MFQLNKANKKHSFWRAKRFLADPRAERKLRVYLVTDFLPQLWLSDKDSPPSDSDLCEQLELQPIHTRNHHTGVDVEYLMKAPGLEKEKTSLKIHSKRKRRLQCGGVVCQASERNKMLAVISSFGAIWKLAEIGNFHANLKWFQSQFKECFLALC